MALSLLYLVLIVLANVFAALWRINLPFGLMVPAGVFFFAPLFTLRDRIQVDRGVKWVYGLIAVSAVVSWVAAWAMGLPLLARVAMASVAAFLFSETLDTVIFTMLRRSFTQRALFSNFFSSFVDSLIFIGFAFGVDWRLILGQWIVKMLIAGLIIPLLAPKNRFRELPV
jgi:queuosine precursor transporter